MPTALLLLLCLLLLLWALQTPQESAPKRKLLPEATGLQEPNSATEGPAELVPWQPQDLRDSAERLPRAPEQDPGQEPDEQSSEPSDPEPPTEDLPLWAKLFEHGSLHPQTPGRSWAVGAGLSNAPTDFDNDVVSSVEVGPGASATLYADGQGSGRRIVLPAGRYDLAGLGLDNELSSIRIAPAGAWDPTTPRGPRDAVQLHQHLPREGEIGEAWSLRLAPSRTSRLFRAALGDFQDNEASAAWVPSGMELILFDQADGYGQALVLGPGLHELLPHGWNDRASSARVSRRQ